MKRGRVRLLLVPIAIGVAIGAVAPWLIGQRMQAAYGQLLGELRRNGLQVIEHSYRSGWFSSRAVTHLVVPGNGRGELRWRAESDLRHFSPGKGSRLGVIRTLLSPQGGGPSVVVDSDVSCNGDSRSALSLASSGRSIGEIHYQLEDHRVETRIGLSELSIPIGKDGQYDLHGLSFSAKSYLGSAGLRLGDMNLQLDGLDFVAPEQRGRRQLRGLYLRSEATAEQGRVLVTSQWRIAAMGWGDLTLSRLEASLRLEGLSSVLLARVGRVLPLFFLQRPPPGGPELALAGTLLSNVTRLLRSEPSLTLEHLRLSTSLGDLDASLHWRLRQPDPRQILDPNHWLRRLELEGRLSLGEALARRLMASMGGESTETGSLDDLRRRGLLRQRGGSLFTELWLHDGQLKVNDQYIRLAH